MPADLRIGVIGAGGRGGLAAHAHAPEDGVRLVAAADPNPLALKHFQDKYGADTVVSADYQDVLGRDDVDAVFVTAPDFLHETFGLAALAAGKHVYLEKPMAITVAGCDRLLAAARDSGKRLYLGHNMRHMGFVLTMRELIQKGAIGEVRAGWCRHFVGHGGDFYFKDWHADRRNTTSMLLQKGAHDIDVLHWLCGGYSRRVVGMGGLSVYNRITDRHPPEERGDASTKAMTWPPLSQTGMNPVLDVEDLSMMLMELDNGVQCSYQQCHYTPDYWRNYTIIGTEGRIENFGEATIHRWNKRGGYMAEGQETIPAAVGTGGHGGSDRSIVAEFVRYCREGGKIATSPIAARPRKRPRCPTRSRPSPRC
jgi:predicted dehydrogenase